MTLSANAIAALVEELEPAAVGALVRRVYAIDADSFVLELRQPGHNVWLLLSTARGDGRLHLVDGKPDQPPEPPAWVMLLRKHLVGGRVTGLQQIASDRVVRLDLEVFTPDHEGQERTEPPTGELHPMSLVVELSGRHANAFLLDAADAVLGSARRDRSTLRPLSLGATWSPPPPPSTPLSPHDPLGLADLPPDGSRSAATAAWTARRHAQQQARAETTALLRRLRDAHKATARRVEAIEQDLARARDAQRYRRYGELLQWAWGKVARGATSARVPDHEAEGMPEVEVPLDPALDLQANIALYFRRYRKYQDALGTIEDRLLAAWDALEALGAALAEATDLASAAVAAASLPDPDSTALASLRDLCARLEAERLLPAARPPQRRAADGAPALPYRTFHSRAGRLILVGRGARHNDTLTLKVARGNDLWLHARDVAGAHVVVRLERNEEVDHETLLDAATLAAHYSQGRDDTLVDVTWTRAKNVRKPRGYPPGLVTVSEGRTIAIRPDPDRLGRLFDKPER